MTTIEQTHYERSLRAGPRVLAKGAKRTKGRATWKHNITVATLMAEMLQTTLGPKGMHKVLTDMLDTLVISGDGVTILRKFETDNPAAKIIVEMAKAIDAEVGDGVTTAVVLAGALLDNAVKLFHERIHPSIIISGYKKALSHALDILKSQSISVDYRDKAVLRSVARTSLDKQLLWSGAEHLANLAAEAAIKVVNAKDGAKRLEPSEDIQIVVKTGGTVLDSVLIDGIIVERQLKHPTLPRRVEDARIALVDKSIRIEKTKNWSELRINSPALMRGFVEEESRMLEEMVERISSAGANVVFCQKGIDDRALYFFGRRGIMAVREVHRRDFEMLAKATHARIAVSAWEITPEHLGYARLVEERDIGAETWVFVEGCEKPGAVSIMLRGGIYKWVEEIKDRVKDALRNIATIVEESRIVAGGGAAEVAAARSLRRYALTLKSKEQMAVNAFADALERIPRILAQNAGLDAISIISDIRHAQENNGVSYGVDVRDGKVKDMLSAGIVDPLKVRETAWKAAVEIACTILRIDEVVWAAKRPWHERPKMTEKSVEWSRQGFIGQPGSYPMYGEPY
ncbi:MAG: thermosome subunit [Aigarchaeota archaeon]|nr:thermosome subunit [Candidatus Pelearchaeum maunauluense]